MGSWMWLGQARRMFRVWPLERVLPAHSSPSLLCGEWGGQLGWGSAEARHIVGPQ